MADLNKCLQCGSPVKHATNDGKRATGSAWMQAVDFNELFCTMRCAARYGIERANKHDSRASN